MAFSSTGIEPYLVASTVNIVVAQRLVRKICQTCRVSLKLDTAQQKILAHQKHIKEFLEAIGSKKLSDINFYKGTGCKVCNNTGYLGRLGIFELLTMSDDIKSLITKNATSGEISRQAQEQGMKTIMQDGLEKVLNGQTTLEEVLRVAKE